ncbi:hypothetical protein [Catenuloplanes indicus]|uniref:Uncharacterized protein n=1 Tax=Catenuloplanes indicus TaxID=137267 RepID=A0AAE4AY57_9ACTN|nr:hypothetical protein [Catenuloplanes indicus]MDQ0366874.1 hypothetical protein [Catenuloplanes indicus]
MDTLPTEVQPRPIRFRDEPAMHHGGAYVAPGRRATAGAWLYPCPEQCRDDGPLGIWIGPADEPGRQVLICPSCGLDCT